MGRYLLRAPVLGDYYHDVYADSVEEAIEIATEDPWDLPEPANVDVWLEGDFELQDILEPGKND